MISAKPNPFHSHSAPGSLSMLLSELKQVLFGAAIEDQTVSNEAASLLASQADVLARDVARNLDQRFVTV